MRTTPFPERNKKIIELRRSGVWPCDIARRLGLSRSTVAGVLYKAMLTLPNDHPLVRERRSEVGLMGAMALNTKRMEVK